MTSMLQSSKSSEMSSVSSSSRAFFNHSSMCEVVVLLSLMIQLQVKDCLSHSSKGLVQVFADVTSSGSGAVGGTKSHPSKSLDKFGLVCLAAAGFESQMSLLSSLEKFEGKVKLPGKESSEVVITELVGANQGFGSSVRVTKSVSVLFFGFKSHLELSSWSVLLAEIFSVDLAISLSFLRVANHVELLPEVRMEGRQNFGSGKDMVIFRKAAKGSAVDCLEVDMGLMSH